jgi:hypothetical protein
MGRFMLAHLQQGQLDGQAILSPATTARMHAASQPQRAGFAAMAHGFFAFTQNGREVIGHGGDTLVFHSDLNLLPKEGVGLFVSFNSRGRDDAVYTARKELVDGFMDRYFPAPPAADPPALATAAADAQRIAGRYQSSRRVENSFLTALYLLSQEVITANPDGSINASAGPVGGMAVFREVAPQVWRKVGGAQELALVEVNGVKTVVDSDNPSSVLQEASFLRSAPLTLTVLSLAVLVLGATLLLWPLAALLRRAERLPAAGSPELRRLRRWQRLAVGFDAAYLLAWAIVIKPILVTDVAFYNGGLDAVVGLLQLSGVLAVAAAAAGGWVAWRLFRVDASRLTRAWGVLVALALLGVVWIGLMGRLMSVNLNY